MYPNWKLSCAIATALGITTARFTFAAGMTASDSSDQLGEVIVTAQRRSENLQDVPITIQALTAETLTQLNVRTFDDYLRYLPNVSASGFGPGQNELYMRGLATTPQAL